MNQETSSVISHSYPDVSSSAILALDDGSDTGIIFYGHALGQQGTSTGEVVFNTSMTGYQEILSDPSYAEQIITLTYPHIGNTGTNGLDNESQVVRASGLIIRNNVEAYSNWRGETSLNSYLDTNNVVAISNIDTRKLTKILRTYGSLNGCITTELSPEDALKEAKTFRGLANTDLAIEVSTQTEYQFATGTYNLEHNTYSTSHNTDSYHVVVYDYGVKENILRMLSMRGCTLTVVNAQTPVNEVLAKNPDGIFLSNGPGDPSPCDYAVANIKQLLEKKIPIFGICLGHQLLGLALGCETAKMKFGHHGANHPVQDTETKKVYITSQNHGFTLDSPSEQVEVTHTSLFDHTIQGIRAKNAPAFGFQGHPEASPGPQDMDYLFDQFISLMQ